MNKDMYDEIYNKYIKKNKISDKDMCDESNEKCIKEDEIFDKDMCDENYDEYMKDDEIDSIFTEDNYKNVDNHSNIKESKIYVNSKLKVDFDTKNKMIYLYPGKTQYFTVDVSKCCGDVTIKYKGNYSSKGIYGNLGIYRIVESGIVVEAYGKLDPRKNDFLNFTAIDKCTKECYNFVVAFACNSCECCY